MPMNPMSPKTLPPVAAFRLLADLNEYTKLPQEQRDTILADYMAAKEEREVMLEAMQRDQAAAAEDRKSAATNRAESMNMAQRTVDDAHVEAKRITNAAIAQSESVNLTVAENVAKAEALAAEMALKIRDRKDAVHAREDACEEREANAFKVREIAVKGREDAVLVDEGRVAILESEAQAMKATYEQLVADFNALQRRAPK